MLGYSWDIEWNRYGCWYAVIHGPDGSFVETVGAYTILGCKWEVYKAIRKHKNFQKLDNMKTKTIHLVLAVEVPDTVSESEVETAINLALDEGPVESQYNKWVVGWAKISNGTEGK